jgi:hypothetical protein
MSGPAWKDNWVAEGRGAPASLGRSVSMARKPAWLPPYPASGRRHIDGHAN